MFHRKEDQDLSAFCRGEDDTETIARARPNVSACSRDDAATRRLFSSVEISVNEFNFQLEKERSGYCIAGVRTHRLTGEQRAA